MSYILAQKGLVYMILFIVPSLPHLVCLFFLKSVFQFRAEEFWPRAVGPFCLRVTPIPMTTTWTAFGRSLCRREPESKWDKTVCFFSIFRKTFQIIISWSVFDYLTLLPGDKNIIKGIPLLFALLYYWTCEYSFLLFSINILMVNQYGFSAADIYSSGSLFLHCLSLFCIGWTICKIINIIWKLCKYKNNRRNMIHQPNTWNKHWTKCCFSISHISKCQISPFSWTLPLTSTTKEMKAISFSFYRFISLFILHDYMTMSFFAVRGLIRPELTCEMYIIFMIANVMHQNC